MTENICIDENLITPWLTPFLNELKNTFIEGRLPHGLLFTGSSGIGKFKLTKQLAQYLLCSNKNAIDNSPCEHCHSCQLFKANNHLDLHMLSSDDSKLISVDTVRKLISSLNEKPYIGDQKVVIIKDANLLSRSAANALLKTLEEPQGNCYIILLCRTHSQLIPTILSRVQQTHIHTPCDSQLLDWLSQQGLYVEDLGLLRLYQNSPLAILNALRDTNKIDERKEAVEGLFALLQSPETLFTFSLFLSQNVEDRMLYLFYLLHDLQKLKFSKEQVETNAIYSFASPQLEIWSTQISLADLRYITKELLHTRAKLMENSGLKKELLINALLIKLKNKFKDHINVS